MHANYIIKYVLRIFHTSFFFSWAAHALRNAFVIGDYPLHSYSSESQQYKAHTSTSK